MVTKLCQNTTWLSTGLKNHPCFGNFTYCRYTYCYNVWVYVLRVITYVSYHVPSILRIFLPTEQAALLLTNVDIKCY